MKEENIDKKKIILTVIAVITLLTVVIGATFAFFTAQTGTGQSASIKADTATTDSLKFESGKTLTINATQQNFGKGAGNESDDTTVKATLVANNETNQASENYNVYLDITENGLKYTTTEKNAELIMKVTGPTGEVTNIPGLKYVTSGGESGFDITEAQGLVIIADQYLIESTGTEEHDWTIKIVLVNLDSNQQGNTEKAFIADVKIQKEDMLKGSLTRYVQNLYTGTQGENDLYYHNATLENGAGDNSYRYSGHEKLYYSCYYNNQKVVTIDEFPTDLNSFTNECNNIYEGQTINGETKYISGAKLAKTIGVEEENIDLSLTEEIEIAWDDSWETCDEINGKYYSILDIFGNTIPKESCKGTITVLKGYVGADKVKAVGSGTIKTIGKNEKVKNYVCFGSDEVTCPSENLYRIIGVFGTQVKLIKADFATAEQLGTDGAYAITSNNVLNYPGNQTERYQYYWDRESDYNNTWSHSLLNTINLNTNFINNIGSTWANKIANTTWRCGLSTINANTAKQYYDEEVGTSNANTYEAKIGLMYASDYGYAATPDNWENDMLYYNRQLGLGGNSWMYLELEEWLINPYGKEHNTIALAITVNGITTWNIWSRRKYTSRLLSKFHSKLCLRKWDRK